MKSIGKRHANGKDLAGTSNKNKSSTTGWRKGNILFHRQQALYKI